jgi:flavin reductase (DIM6/NTAB) family NADH-FMN oxidoreductase RutF
MSQPDREARETVSADNFREVIRHLASGVTIITSMSQGTPVGMTATAVCSISATPPIILVSLTTTSHTAGGVQHTGAFAVHLITDSGKQYAEQFASKGDHFQGVSYQTDEVTGVPVLNDVLGHFVCRVEQSIPVADHILFVGRVVRCELKIKEPHPLLYFDRSYRKISPVSEAKAGNLEPWGSTQDSGLPGWGFF